MSNAGISGMNAASNAIKLIGHHIANAGTYGFKGSRINLGDVYSGGILGVSNGIGNGVKINSITTNFTQGALQNTDNNLDLSINRNGFFVVEDGGTRHYTRAGAFRVDKDSNIANSQGQKLMGYVANANGNITGALGSLKIEKMNLESKVSSRVDMSFNLNESVRPPARDFQAGFTSANLPHEDSYNFSKTTTIYDSLGRKHDLTSYFVKDKSVNTWRVYVGINGNDITPAATNPPALNGMQHVNYQNNDLARPFTVKFDSSGNYIPHNAVSAQYFGGNAYASAALPIANAGTFNRLNVGDLSINGISIEQAQNRDNVSTVDNAGSAISIVESINSKRHLHGVEATVNATTFRLQGLANTGNPLAGNNLVINGQQIAGNVNNRTALIALINAQTQNTGVRANPFANNGTDIVLQAQDGRNIQLETDGNTGNISFNNFNMNNPGNALNQVVRGTYTLDTQNNHLINIGGENAALLGLGLTAGYKKGIVNHCSDNITINNFNPGNGAAFPQQLAVNLDGTTQFGSGFATYDVKQDGYGVGILTGVDVGENGIIKSRYTNGNSKILGQVALANFNDVNSLQQQGDTCFVETAASGSALLGTAGSAGLGTINSASLECSNVELTPEMLRLLEEHKNFQANAQALKIENSLARAILDILQ